MRLPLFNCGSNGSELNHIPSLCICISLALCIPVIYAAAAQTPAPTEFTIYSQGNRVSQADMLNRLKEANVVFVGEEHDDPIAHQLELDILQGLYTEHPKVMLSMEMFERDVQPQLNEYLDGFITEPSFLACSRPWPNYKTDYRPLVEFCKANHISIIAANAPRRYVNMVSREGMSSLNKLPKISKSYIAPIPYSMKLPSGYETELDSIFGVSHEAGVKKDEMKKGESVDASMPSPENMKQAQALWDSTMADSVEKAIHTHPGYLIMQMNGRMHSDSGWGIAARLHQKMPHLKILIVSIHKAGAPMIYRNDEQSAGDYVILTTTQPEK